MNATPRPLFTPGKDPVPTVEEAGWVPGPVWTRAKNLSPTEIRSQDRPARSQSLYPLSYPSHYHIILHNYILFSPTFFATVSPNNGTASQTDSYSVVGEKFVPVTLCPPQIPCGLALNRTRFSAATCLRKDTAMECCCKENLRCSF